MFKRKKLTLKTGQKNFGSEERKEKKTGKFFEVNITMKGMLS